MKRQSTKWENIVTNDTSDKGLIPKIYKELILLYTKNPPNNPIKKYVENLHKFFSKEDIQKASIHVKRYSISRVITEIQIKNTMRYHLKLVRMAVISKINKQQVLVRMWRKGSPTTLLGIQTGAATLKTSIKFSQKIKNDLLYDPMIPLLGIYPKKPDTLIQKNICIPITIAVVFRIAKLCKQPSAHQQTSG